MSKTLSRDIRIILRQFEIAGELTAKSEISLMKEIELGQGCSLITFVFDKAKYYILIDGNADDDVTYILEQIQTIESEVRGAMVRNPLDNSQTTYGMPFKGKDAYLYKLIVEKRRLDVELSNRYPDLSRSTIQKYIKAGHVQVGGKVVLQPKKDVLETDDISMVPPVMSDFSEQQIPIIYIDDNVIVVSKPTGLLTHSKGVMNDEFTVADFFRRYTTFGLETNRPGIVHRLDRDTSGIIIGARNDEAAALLKEQFAERKTQKEYMAVTDGIPKTANAIIDLPIGRNPSAPSTFRIDSNGKAALTTYEVVATNKTQALIKLWPKTGRTHQLRVHMAYVGAPIAGDRVYNKKKAGRLYLHAQSLEITIPPSKRVTFTTPVPNDFTDKFPGYKNV